MCLLILLQGFDPEVPILVASNRDELRTRRAAPPGLFVGERHRIVSPRDRAEGGTWMGVNDVGMFAGLTNLAESKHHPEAVTRGQIPHLALDANDLETAVQVVTDRVAAECFNGFQLLLALGQDAVVLVHQDGVVDRLEVEGPVAVISNEHRLGELDLNGLSSACTEGQTVEQLLAELKPLLLDEGGESGHAVLKKGEVYGTVSSSLIAVRPRDPRHMTWLYAAGAPDVAEYRNYGNIGRRLIEE